MDITDDATNKSSARRPDNEDNSSIEQDKVTLGHEGAGGTSYSFFYHGKKSEHNSSSKKILKPIVQLMK